MTANVILFEQFMFAQDMGEAHKYSSFVKNESAERLSIYYISTKFEDDPIKFTQKLRVSLILMFDLLVTLTFDLDLRNFVRRTLLHSRVYMSSLRTIALKL